MSFFATSCFSTSHLNFHKGNYHLNLFIFVRRFSFYRILGSANGLRRALCFWPSWSPGCVTVCNIYSQTSHVVIMPSYGLVKVSFIGNFVWILLQNFKSRFWGHDDF